MIAKNELKYNSDKSLPVIDEWMEYFQYYLLKSSCQLSKEKGKCEKFENTKYSKGVLPIDTYKDKVDELVKRKLSLDWEKLRKDIKEFGLRHSTLSSCMPCESSSVIPQMALNQFVALSLIRQVKWVNYQLWFQELENMTIIMN